MKKILKRITCVLVLVLAFIGIFSLLKKAPQLNVPEEDRSYLEEIGISVQSGLSAEGGLSGVMDTVEGIPPLGSSNMTGGNSSAPAFLAGDIAPAFNASEEAPAFGGSNFDRLEAPPFVAASPATSVASAYQESRTRQAPPFVSAESLESAPKFVDPEPAVTPETTPSLPPTGQIPKESAPAAQIPSFSPQAQNSPINGIFQPVDISAAPPPRNGPGVTTTTQPSTASKQPWGDFGDLNQDVRSKQTTLASDRTEERSEARIRRLPTPEDPEIVRSPTKPDSPATHPKVMVAETFPEPIPSITTPAATPETPDLFRETFADTSTAYVSPVVSDDYRQTSIRRERTFTSPASVKEEEAPIISFAQQKPVSREIPPNTPPAPPIPETVEVLPFTQNDSAPRNSDDTNSGSLTAPIRAPAVTMASPASTPPLNTEEGTLIVRETVERFVLAQNTLAESGDPTKIRNAFVQLSCLYEHKELNEAERRYMNTFLDRMALNVIYSKKTHILEPAYVVKEGDTVGSVAAEFNISPALLMKINGLTGARSLQAGTELKVVVGHFDAKISVIRREMTLILGGLYAGRFPVAPGERIESLRGDFFVTSKTDTMNRQVLTLNNGVTLCAVDPSGSESIATSVRLSDQDVGELFDILTERSVIVFED